MPDNREELKAYRLEMARERLRSSKILLEAGSYKDSIGRSYYAMFMGVRALLAVEGRDFSKHAGVIQIIWTFSSYHYRIQRNSMRGMKNL